MPTKRKKTTPTMMVGRKRPLRKKKLGGATPSPCPSPSPAPNDDGGSPARAIACLNVIEDMTLFEQNEDCFILGFDPYNPLPQLPPPQQPQLPDLNEPPPPPPPPPTDDVDADDDLSIIAETGQVACRDYPHSRHLCVKFPFEATSHEARCELCYCYVCDSPAPCQFWNRYHCNAHDTAHWESEREVMRKFKESTGSSGL